MFGRKYSNLNPLASSFVPGKITEENYKREVAEKYLKDLMEKRKAKGEKSLTKFEMASLVGQLICLKFKVVTSSDIVKINSYLSDKILTPEASAPEPKNTLVSVKQIPKRNINSFDLSKFQPPEESFLLVAFWGLHRHEQAQRPLLSLPFRPEILMNKVWSLDSSDKELWNRSCVKNVCKCPPMFGYIVPPKYFGNPLSIPYSCPERKIHLNHYPDSLDGNEFILTSNWNFNVIDEQLFVEDFKDKVSDKVSLKYLKEQFVSTVDGLCDFLAKYNDSDDLLTDDEAAGDTDCENYDVSLWDSDEYDHSGTRYDRQNENLEDDNEHPLLQAQDFEPDEGVPREIEEMIRRSLSPKRLYHSPGMNLEEDVDEHVEICDPPCSIWCEAANKSSKDKDFTVTVEIKLAPEPVLSTEYIPQINLVSPEGLFSSAEADGDSVNIVDLKPALDLSRKKIAKPSYRRSFSVNDCDPYYDGKFGFNGTMAQASGSVSSSEMLSFLRRDPVNFFKTFNRSNSWKDTDSGFVSQGSSQEDLFEKDYRDQDDKGSMWGLFTGEDSLWKPLPECLISDGIDEKPLPHRRVRDLR